MRAAYGIDLRGDGACMVRAERLRGRIRYVSVAPDDSQALARLEKRGVCVGHIACRESFARWLLVPFPGRSKAMRVLPTLLDVELPFPVEECVCRFPVVRRARAKAGVPRRSDGPAGPESRPVFPGEAKAGVRALAVGARRENVERRLKAFKEAGFTPDILDHQGLLLWAQTVRELAPSQLPPGAVRVLVCLAGDESAVVLGQGIEFISAHALRSCDVAEIRRVATAALSAVAGPGDAEPGAGHREIAWVWAGPGALDRGAIARICSELKAYLAGPCFIHEEPDAMLARALAARGLEPGPASCNLAATGRGDLFAAGGSGRAAALVLAAGILLCAANLFVRHTVHARERTVAQAVACLAVELGAADGAVGEHAIRTAAQSVGRKMEALQPFIARRGASLLTDLAEVVKAGQSEDLRYESLVLTGTNIEAAGTAVSWDAPEKVSALLRSRGFVPNLERKDALSDERIPFTIRGERGR